MVQSSTAADDSASLRQQTRKRLAVELDAMELHRSFGVRDRLARAAELEATAISANDMLSAMRARLVHADMLQRVGEMPRAVELAVEVHRWAMAEQAHLLLARSHLVLSTMFEVIGEPASSLDHAVRGMDLVDEHATPRRRGELVMRLADALAFSGLAHQARRRYAEAGYLFGSINDRELSLIVLNNTAVLESEQGNAIEAAQAARKLQRTATAHEMNADFAETIARAHLVAGDLPAAEAAARLGQELMLEHGDTTAIAPAELSMTLAEILLASGRVEAAQAELDDCRTICEQRGLAGMGARALELQARLHAARNDFRAAYDTYREFHAATVALHSQQQETAARSREAVLRTTEALRNAEHFRIEARVDPLTDLYNRRFVNEVLPQWLAQHAEQPGTTLAVALLDLDHFKDVNDRFSHATGDQVIHVAARTFAQLVGGSSDVSFIARIGGEEFLLVDRQRGRHGVAELVERLRRVLAERDWSDVAAGVNVTLSAGIAFAQHGDTVGALLERADQQLYAAKAAGRNRVMPSTV
jgi:diguanylate cyclase (GGDEF)-like protein